MVCSNTDMCFRMFFNYEFAENSKCFLFRFFFLVRYLSRFELEIRFSGVFCNLVMWKRTSGELSSDFVVRCLLHINHVSCFEACPRFFESFCFGSFSYWAFELIRSRRDFSGVFCQLMSSRRTSKWFSNGMLPPDELLWLLWSVGMCFQMLSHHRMSSQRTHECFSFDSSFSWVVSLSKGCFRETCPVCYPVKARYPFLDVFTFHPLWKL